MNKTAIKNFAVWARRKLISDITYKAGLLGITENGIAQPLKQSTGDLLFFDIGTKDYAEVSGAAIRQRKALAARIEAKAKETDYKTAFQYVVEEVAYTWFNRLIAIRFMEVNDYLTGQVRALSSANPDKLEPDLVTDHSEAELPMNADEEKLAAQYKDENRLDELFRMLFIKECNRLGRILPDLFERISDYTELLLTISFTNKDGVVYHLTHDIPEDDFNVEREGQIEIIGWLYQYYNTEPKDRVFENLKKNVKISKENIPAATQLFTPDWIVRYMVENSLGRLWTEGHPDGGLKANWKYYLEEAGQEPEVEEKLAEIRREYAALNPEEIRVIDPCMGSGHILVYLFDVLMQIYESCGYTARDAVQAILEKNLYGLDIDDRAAQLSYFAVMMKAREYDRRFFNRKDENGEPAIPQPNVFGIRETRGWRDGYLADNKGFLNSQEHRDTLDCLLSAFAEAKEYGSILQPENRDYEGLLEAWETEAAATAADCNMLLWYDAVRDEMPKVIRQAMLLTQKYHAVVTNPPYMGASGMSAKLGEFVKKNYPDSKSDLSTVFMEKTMSMCAKNGFTAMINIPVWMFLSSFEKLRENLILKDTFINMVHPGRGIFGSDFGTTTFVLRRGYVDNYIGTYARLFQKQGEVESIEVREQQFLSGENRYTAKQTNFSKIPGSPVAYWVSENVYKAYSNVKTIEYIADVRHGLSTGKNDIFVRQWTEIPFVKIDTTVKDQLHREKSQGKFYPYNKGGEYRKWYGNADCVVWYDKDGQAKMKSMSGHRHDGRDRYFQEGITWSFISSSNFGVRYTPNGFVFDVAGSSMFADHETIVYLTGLLCSKLGQYFMSIQNPTMNFQVGNLKNVPVIRACENEIKKLVTDCISLSRADWDSFETSWDFKRHPLLTYSGFSHQQVAQEVANGYQPMNDLAYAYRHWENACDDRFRRLKANEEELNRIFIDIYGLQEELTPDVDEKDVTVRRADLGRDVRSLISYAVGCMFGRYSLDCEGLAYAGGEWDASKYVTFPADEDNCIPVTDTEYFADDIVGRFVSFVRTVWGEETLEENLRFIADALGGKGSSSRDVIRRYFLNDFYADHLKIYQKRPIYWLFDSGKQNGFKALVYLHRWNEDTVGNVRVEYLHRMERVYEREIETVQDVLDNSTNSREITLTAKKKEKLLRQLKECRGYDAGLGHIALSRIRLDLDDGVKVNYRKAQTGADGRFCEILANSRDIMAKD